MKKSIIKNSIYNVIYKGFSAFFPLFTSAYISRVLLADGVGKISFANTIVMYFTTIAALGIPTYGVKIIAQQNNDKKNRTKAFIELFLINLVSTIICTISYYFIVNQINFFSDKKDLMNVMGLMIILNIFNIDWFYQGIEEYGYIASRSILIKFVSFILMFIFVRDKNDLLIYALLLTFALAGNYIFNIVNVNKYLIMDRYNLSIKKYLKPIFILLGASLATEIYTMLDTVMIEIIHGDLYVGYYSNAVKLVRMIYTIVISFVATFYPRISLYLKNNQGDLASNLLSQGTKLILMLSIPCVLGIFVIANDLVPLLFGSDFFPTITTIRILAILVLVFSLAYFLGHIILISKNREDIILKATITGAGINMMFNLFLIPVLYQNGAAISSVIAEISVTIFMMKSSFAYISIKIDRKFWKSLIISNCIFGLILFLMNVLLPIEPILKMLFYFIVSPLVYFVLLFCFKNELMISLKIYILNRVKNV